MATYTLYGVAASGRVTSDSPSSYAAARDGTGTLSVTASGMTTGHAYEGVEWSIYQPQLGFDVGTDFWALYPTAVVSAAEVRTNVVSVNASNGKTFQMRLHDWGVAVTTADYVAGGSLSGKTLLCSHTQNASTGQKTWTGAGLLSNLPSSGVYRMLLCALDTVDNVTPTSTEYITQSPTDDATQANRPQLVLTYTIPGGGSSGSPKMSIGRMSLGL